MKLKKTPSEFLQGRKIRTKNKKCFEFEVIKQKQCCIAVTIDVINWCCVLVKHFSLRPKVIFRWTEIAARLQRTLFSYVILLSLHRVDFESTLQRQTTASADLIWLTLQHWAIGVCKRKDFKGRLAKLQIWINQAARENRLGNSNKYLQIFLLATLFAVCDTNATMTVPIGANNSLFAPERFCNYKIYCIFCLWLTKQRKLISAFEDKRTTMALLKKEGNVLWNLPFVSWWINSIVARKKISYLAKFWASKEKRSEHLPTFIYLFQILNNRQSSF